jgi:CubicO group peptidase (beta-lactamase class C family)
MQSLLGNNLRARMLDAKTEEDPDKNFKYSSINTLLLSYIIEKSNEGNLHPIICKKIMEN